LAVRTKGRSRLPSTCQETSRVGLLAAWPRLGPRPSGRRRRSGLRLLSATGPGPPWT
jgi:hypothetical protein